jgi:methyl-accepting chemotaxis protein
MKLSFVQKLWLPLILSLLCLAGISIYNAYQTREMRLDERKADLKHASEIALSVVKTFGDQATAGAMPVAEAQKRSGTCGTAKTVISWSSIPSRRS